MNSHRHVHRSLGLALTAVAVATAPAFAMPIDRAVGVTSPEQQALAPRGAAPSPSPAVAAAKGDHPKRAGNARLVERLRQIEQRRLQALVDADVAVAGPLLASDFELINPLGEVSNRDDMLGAVGSGAIDFLSDEVTRRSGCGGTGTRRCCATGT